MTSPRDKILARVRLALAPLAVRAPLPEWEGELIKLRAAHATTDAWTLFAERLRSVNGTPFTSVADLVAYLDHHGHRHGYCDPALHARFSAAFPPSFTVETNLDRARIDDYQFGLTAAVGAIAETGTLILSDAATSRRLGALAPWVHIAVLHRDQIHQDLAAAIAALPTDPNVIWCTGPSKTADVEGILIEGVHGPGVQGALLIDA